MKLIRYGPLVLFLSLFALLFYSCSEDPVTPSEDFDPPRFNWRTMDIYYHGFAGMWAQDTSKIFLLNHYNRNLYIVSGGNVTMQNVGNYYLNEIKGLSNSQVYLFGTGFDSYMTLIKWNGAGFEYYPTNIFMSVGIYSLRGCAVSSNEVWLCSRNGISKFDGVKMTDYSYEDPQSAPIDIFLTNDGKVQYISERIIDTAHIQESLFEFRDTGFVKTYDHIIFTYDRSGTFLREVGGYKFGLHFNAPLGSAWSVCIRYFTGSSFTNYFCFPNKIASSWSSQSNNPVGFNLQNFIFLAATDPGVFDPYRFGIVHWNGTKASRELGLGGHEPFIYEAYILYAINENNYLLLEPYHENQQDNKLHIGSRK